MAQTIETLIQMMIRPSRSIEWETDATRDGCQVYRCFYPGERYRIDFAPDFRSGGWQQFDTDQDASYFGVWLNPKKQMALTYAEGDWTLVVCPDRERYLNEVKRCFEFYDDGFICKAIDSEGNLTVYQQSRAMFFKDSIDNRVSAFCEKIKTNAQATRLWNWIDHQDNSDDLFPIMLAKLGWAFQDDRDANSMRFEYH